MAKICCLLENVVSIRKWPCPGQVLERETIIGYIYTHTGQLLRRELKPYRIGLLFTRNYGDLGVISVAEQSYTAPISKMERHVSDRFDTFYRCSLDRYLDGSIDGC